MLNKLIFININHQNCSEVNIFLKKNLKNNEMNIHCI